VVSALATLSAISIAFSPTSADIELDAGEQAGSDLAPVEAQGQSRAYDSGGGPRLSGAN
jgi:hypothetical protein